MNTVSSKADRPGGAARPAPAARGLAWAAVLASVGGAFALLAVLMDELRPLRDAVGDVTARMLVLSGLLVLLSGLLRTPVARRRGDRIVVGWLTHLAVLGFVAVLALAAWPGDDDTFVSALIIPPAVPPTVAALCGVLFPPRDGARSGRPGPAARLAWIGVTDLVLTGSCAGLALGAGAPSLPGLEALVPADGRSATLIGGVALGAACGAAVSLALAGTRLGADGPVATGWKHAFRLAAGCLGYGLYLAVVSLLAAQAGRLLPAGAVFFVALVLLVLSNVPLALVFGRSPFGGSASTGAR